MSPIQSQSDACQGDFLSANLTRFIKEMSRHPNTKDFDFLTAYCNRLVDFAFMTKELSSPEMQELINAISIGHYSAGSYIMLENEDVDYYSVVLDGYVCLYTSSHLGECSDLIRPCFRGSQFSDLDLLTNSASSISALAKIDSYVLHIPKATFTTLLSEKCLQTVLNFQKFIFPESDIDTQAFKFIYHSIEKLNFKPEQTIVHQGERCDFLYYLLNGQCKVSCRHEKQSQEIKDQKDGEFLWTYKDVCRVIKKGACLNEEGALNKKSLPYSIQAGNSEVCVFRIHMSVAEKYTSSATLASMLLKANEKQQLREGQVEQARRVRGNTRRSSVGPLGLTEDGQDSPLSFRRSNVTLSAIEDLENGTLATVEEKLRMLRKNQARSFLVLLNKGLALRFGMGALRVVPYEVAAFQCHAIKVFPKNALQQRLQEVTKDSYDSEGSPRKLLDNSHLRLDFLCSTFFTRLREATISTV
eukprot:CAMPEP_0114974774 /NCGR_PEP_ID=MMETSP0216-20121206/1716_1 /TAXON_ID=223996 /ORGANISM="Protocruzia adherens, Strain Boccale" /LENGTH=470 /DNA_ID=CAMNT_0002335453 /DNA_START=213 /DNA_END=1625 /DNA_ORIENTATION=-